jgi:hypothetical protein
MNHKNEGMCLKAWVSARVVTKTMKNPMRLDLRLKKKIACKIGCRETSMDYNPTKQTTSRVKI